MLYLGALSASDESLANILDLKHWRSLDVVPILLGKRISAEEEDKKRVTEERYMKMVKVKRWREWTLTPSSFHPSSLSISSCSFPLPLRLCLHLSPNQIGFQNTKVCIVFFWCCRYLWVQNRNLRKSVERVIRSYYHILFCSI